MASLDREQESFQTVEMVFSNAEGVSLLTMNFLQKKKYAKYGIGRRDDLMVTALDSGLRDTVEPARGHYVVFLGKTLLS